MDQKVNVKVQSKVGSLANVKHKPGGGDKKVFNDVEYMKQVSDHAVALTNPSGPGSLTSSRRESSSQVRSSHLFFQCLFYYCCFCCNHVKFTIIKCSCLQLFLPVNCVWKCSYEHSHSYEVLLFLFYLPLLCCFVHR